MQRRDVVRHRQTDAEQILNDLSARQYLRPHQSLGDALGASSIALGFCPAASETALRWLMLDPMAPIGRVRRTELIQLSRSIYRFWQQAIAATEMENQPV